MGLNDDREMLEAAKADVILLERELQRLKDQAAIGAAMAEPILLYALRYTLGRQTFAPSDVQAAVRAAMPIHDRGVLEAMIRDIEQAGDLPGGLGDWRIDAPGWTQLLSDLRATP